MASARSSEAQRSIDRLFAEPFEPRWMAVQREARAHAEMELAGLYWRARRRAERYNPDLRYERRMRRRRDGEDKIDAAWRASAHRSRLSIAAKCQGAHYQN